MKLLIVDNYDSFTYNLYQYLNELLAEQSEDYSITVKRNDEIALEEVEDYDVIVISPGPGIPDESGLTKPIIKAYSGKKPILGVCLGLQAMVEAFGGSIRNLNEVYHGVYSLMDDVEDDDLFRSIERPIQIGRYHSWVADTDDFPEVLSVLARDQNGQIMAIRHKEYATVGVQFHPESILTPSGKQILSNFLREAKVSIEN